MNIYTSAYPVAIMRGGDDENNETRRRQKMKNLMSKGRYLTRFTRLKCILHADMRRVSLGESAQKVKILAGRRL
jgi:hypothetical protein